MIWATASSSSCFCWLYRVSPSLAAKNIINLILVLTIVVMSMCRVFSCVLGRGYFLWPVVSLGKIGKLWPASFCTVRPNLPVTPGVSWLPTFAFQSPIMKRTFFFFLVLVLEGLVGLYRTVQLQLLQHYWLGHSLDYCDIEWFALERNRVILLFLRLHPSTAFQTLLLTLMATPFLLRDSWPQ